MRTMGLVSGVALIAAAAAGDTAAARPEATTVTVIMREYRFEPAKLEFRRGQTYRLHLVNRGRELHEFTAPQFFKTVKLGNPGMLSPTGDIVVRPQEQKTVSFVASTPGRYPLICADHDWAGMTGEIVVSGR